MPAFVDDTGKHEYRNDCEIDKRRWLNTQDAADIEGLKVESTDKGFLFEDARADEDSADREEEVDTISAVSLERGSAISAYAPGQIVSHQNAEDGDGAPSIEAGQIA